jgi:hypothetical protein
MNKRGQWMTAVQADGAGFPDLVLVRGRIIFAELKAAGRQLSSPQVAWAEAIHKAGGEFYVWKPKDWDEIEAVLRRVERGSSNPETVISVTGIDTGYGDAA